MGSTIQSLKFGPAGRFELQAHERRLLVDGAPANLGARAFDLLLALADRPGQLLTKHDLMDQVWPKAVVSPETLGQRVKLLRDALGDDPRAPRYVEGLRGRGYRLIPPVESDDGSVASESMLPKRPEPTEVPVPAVQVSASPVEASVVAQSSPTTRCWSSPATRRWLARRNKGTFSSLS